METDGVQVPPTRKHKFYYRNNSKSAHNIDFQTLKKTN